MRGPLLLVAGLAFAEACGHRPDRYPPDVVQNFLASCTTRSDPRVCRCAIDALQARFTLDEFRGFETRLNAGEMPREMLDVLARCRD